MTTETTPQEGAPAADQASAAVVSPAIVATYEAMVADIPEAGGDGYEAILVQIANATDAGSLDAPWRSDGLSAYLGEPLTIRGLKRMASEYGGGLPFFLIVDAASVVTGELITFTTGAVSVVAQLAKANQLGLIPGWRVVPRQAERPSSSGYFPQHLEVMRGRMAAES